MVARAGVEAKLGFPAHPHMLRHACGFALANKGFRRLKAHKQLSVLRAALQAHHDRMAIKPVAHVTRAA